MRSHLHTAKSGRISTDSEDRHCNHGNPTALFVHNTTQHGQQKVAWRGRNYSQRCTEDDCQHKRAEEHRWGNSRTNDEMQVNITEGGGPRRRRKTRDTQGKTRLPKWNRKWCCWSTVVFFHTTTSTVYRERSQKKRENNSMGDSYSMWWKLPCCYQRSEVRIDRLDGDDNLPNLIKWLVIVYCWSMSSKHGSTPIKSFNLCHWRIGLRVVATKEDEGHKKRKQYHRKEPLHFEF